MILLENVKSKLSAEICYDPRTHFRITTTLSKVITVHAIIPFQRAFFPSGLHRSKSLHHRQPLVFLKCFIERASSEQEIRDCAGDPGGEPGKGPLAKGHLRLEQACDYSMKSCAGSLSPGFIL